MMKDSLRYKTIPALEAEMEAQDYSTESVGHFLGICVGWLNGHIMVEDRAITEIESAQMGPPAG